MRHEEAVYIVAERTQDGQRAAFELSEARRVETLRVRRPSRWDWVAAAVSCLVSPRESS